MKTIRPDLANESHETNKTEIQESNKDSHILQCEQDYENVIQAVFNFL